MTVGPEMFKSDFKPQCEEVLVGLYFSVLLKKTIWLNIDLCNSGSCSSRHNTDPPPPPTSITPTPPPPDDDSGEEREKAMYMYAIRQGGIGDRPRRERSPYMG